MKIMPSDFKIQNSKRSSFRAIIVPDPQAQQIIYKYFNKKQINSMKKLLEEQKENPVHVFFTAKTKKRLQAKVYCPYFIKDFKEIYTQRPIIESAFGFVKRVLKKIEVYKNILSK